MTVNDVAALAYNFYWISAIGALWAVASYAIRHSHEMAFHVLLFSFGATLNLAGDAASKVWFWLWRLIGKPAYMVDHPFVVIVTLLAAVGILIAVRFWTVTAYGEKAWLSVLGFAAGGAFILRSLGG